MFSSNLSAKASYNFKSSQEKNQEIIKIKHNPGGKGTRNRLKFRSLNWLIYTFFLVLLFSWSSFNEKISNLKQEISIFFYVKNVLKGISLWPLSLTEEKGWMDEKSQAYY